MRRVQKMEKEEMIRAINSLAKQPSCSNPSVSYMIGEYEMVMGVTENNLLSVLIRKDMPDGDYDTTATDAINNLNSATPLGCYFIEDIGGKKKYNYRIYLPSDHFKSEKAIKSFEEEVLNRADEGFSVLETRLILAMNKAPDLRMI